MKAIVWTRYGPPDGLELAELPKPAPADDQVLIKIRATTVAAGDCEMRALRFSLGLMIVVRLMMGVTKPRRKVLGQEFAGEVEAVGRRASRFNVGDRVFGTTGFAFGAYAEYICLPERAFGRALEIMPGNMTFEEAAAVPTSGLEAMHFVQAAGELSGRRVLINGAAGGIGSFAIQLAKQGGAEVTGVDGPSKLEAMRAIGADHVIDYTQHGYASDGESFDLILDVVGTTSFPKCVALLNEGGTYCVANPRFTTLLRGLRTSRHGGRKVLTRASGQSSEDLANLRRMIEAGQIRSVIDRTYPLDKVPEAHRYVDSGQVAGKVVVTVSSGFPS